MPTNAEIRFSWIPQEKKFHFEVIEHVDGRIATLAAFWVNSNGAVQLFNSILNELRRAAVNPEILPKPITLVKKSFDDLYSALKDKD